ncbi:MAG: glycosyltransferase family 9 protein [Myxococcota bacterium]
MGAPRILVIRLTALGDVILALPVAQALRSAVPGASIELLTEAKMVPLLEAWGAFDRVLAYERHGVDRGLAGLLGVRRRLAPRYAAVVDLQGKLRTRILSWLIPADSKLVLRKRSLGQSLLSLIGRRRPIQDRHSVDLYLDALRPLGVERRLEAPGPEVIAKTPRRIGLGVGASHPTKRWPPERFAELSALLAAEDPERRFVLIGGPQDRAELERLRALVPPALLDPVDPTALDVAGLAELIRGLDLLVSVDSGAAHIAQAVGVRTLVLFGPTAPARWGPRQAPHRALSLYLDCAPCSDVGGQRCPRPDRDLACMKGLSAAMVAGAIRGDPA